MKKLKKKNILGCYIDIKPVLGGLDSEDWCRMLFRMYSRWSSINSYVSEILNIYNGVNKGIKYVSFKILGEKVYKLLYKETGIHRLIRRSPFKKTKNRQTSLSSVYVYPFIKKRENILNINLNSKNIRIDTYRSSGAGGQHVNCTDSAVRLTHIPTGLITQSQDQRSQHFNKLKALKQLKSKLSCLSILEETTNKRLINNYKKSLHSGYYIRSYILDDNIIKDLHTGKKIRNTKDFLNGNLDTVLIY